MRGKQLDADQAGRVVSLIERESAAFRRQISYCVTFSMISMLQTKEQRHIYETLHKKNIPILRTGLMERAAFSAIFQVGGTIFDLDKTDVTNPKAAQEDAQDLAKAVIETLKDLEERAA